MNVDNRTTEQLREQYEIEKELANKLRNASKDERRYLYSSLYDELFERVPHHSQLTRKSSPEKNERYVSEEIRIIKPFLRKDNIFLEVGPGDCAMSFAVTQFVKEVYAVDVSEKITNSVTRPPNFHLIISDGCNIPLPENTVNVAYSNQLMEHLHPDDAFEQLENIYRALTLGGVYICITPNRLGGPHDISRYFEDEFAVGFHLKEYSIRELNRLFRKVGFSSTSIYIEFRKKYIRFPVFLIVMCESILDMLPYALRKFIYQVKPFSYFISIRLIGIK